MITSLKTSSLLFLLICLFFISSCLPEEELPSEEKLVYVSFKMNGELKTTDIPLTGRIADDGENTIYGVQVNSLTHEDDNDPIPYAYGIFSNQDSMDLALLENKIYEVSATAFRKGTGYGLYNSISNNGHYYGEPFGTYLSNKFIYNNNSKLYIRNSWVSTFISDDPERRYETAFLQRSEITRYLSDKMVFEAEDSSRIDLPLLSVNFGVEISINNPELMTGDVQVTIEGASNIDLKEDKTESGLRILQFADLYYFYNSTGDPKTYSESIRTSVFREIIQGEDTIVDVLYDDKIEYKRNMIKQIQITLPENEGSGRGQGLFLHLEDAEMQYDSEVILVN